MAKKTANAISPTRAEDYAEWYQQVVRAADLAENAPVRGCMVIKPWGYALWERIQGDLDARLKATGHRNAYFPLFIPKSLLEKEAAHVEGFAKECAVVTHHRLVLDASGALVVDPDAVLEEPLIVRPTSETIIGATFAKWIGSYRDLPLLVNQWANVVRWELRPRMFLRTAEFLWQEGHTAHETAEEAREETLRILDLYADFAETMLAMPVVKGVKSASERFPGAVETYTIEAMMQDRKALQAGTSHDLGQNFAHASEIRFQSREGALEYAWTTSWGVSTRLIGALIMTHADDDGLVLPPRIAPAHAVILPILRNDESRARVLESVDQLAEALRAERWHGRPLEVEIDRRDVGGGQKQWEWVKKGIPLRLEVGPRDVERGTVSVARRDRPVSEKTDVARGELPARVAVLLDEIQAGLLARAQAFRAEHTRKIGTREEIDAFFTPVGGGDADVYGGFSLSPWCGDAACEETLRTALKITIRCLPLGEQQGGEAPCVVCGRPTATRAIFARNY